MPTYRFYYIYEHDWALWFSFIVPELSRIDGGQSNGSFDISTEVVCLESSLCAESEQFHGRFQQNLSSVSYCSAFSLLQTPTGVYSKEISIGWLVKIYVGYLQKIMYGCYMVLKPLIPGVRWSFVVNDFYWCFDNRLTAMSSSEEFSDITDIELIQHINVDCSRLIKLLNGE